MSLNAPEDAASLLEQFVHDVANTPAEITHLLEEIEAKDSRIHVFKEEINKRDLALQKWVRANGGHTANPKEDPFSRTINDCYDKCEILQAEKCGLSEKALIVLERQIKRLDTGLRHLAHSGDFPADWGGPTLLGGSGNVTGVNTPLSATGATVPTGPLQAVSGNAGPAVAPSIANAAQIRMAAQTAARTPASGTQTPTAIPRGQRESSSEASNKRRRLNPSLSSLPTATSTLRQSSLGPGTPKAGTPVPAATGGSRAGSAQPNRPSLSQKKNPSQPGARKPVPPQGRKRDRMRNASKKGGGGDRRRQLKSDRATPSTNASASSDSEGSTSPTPSSLPRSQADGAADRKRGGGHGDRPGKHGEDDAEGEDDDEDGDDDALYCFCQKRSYGEMIGCDNDDCQYQWFHFGCVDMKEQPSGEWLCPSCKKLPRSQIVKSE